MMAGDLLELIGLLVLFVLLLLVIPVLTMVCWNYLMAGLFGLPEFGLLHTLAAMWLAFMAKTSVTAKWSK